MNIQEKQFRAFEDLEVYQTPREFRKAMFRVARRLPDFEKFRVAGQIRRAALSLQSRGSLEEVLDDLNVRDDEACLAP